MRTLPLTRVRRADWPVSERVGFAKSVGYHHRLIEQASWRESIQPMPTLRDGLFVVRRRQRCNNLAPCGC
jgi:hypothetical protein